MIDYLNTTEKSVLIGNIVLCVGGSRDKVSFIFYKVERILHGRNHSYEVSLMLFMFHNTF